MNEELINKILEFDASDEYHELKTSFHFSSIERGYYEAIDRVIRLLKGEIKDWQDKGLDISKDLD